MRVLIIIPAFNEQTALGGLLAEIRALAPGVAELTTVVVDDGSSDRTAAVAREGGARVLELCGNLGIGGAVQSGLRLAAREGFDYAIQVDGDGQHPPSELARLLEAAATTPPPDLLVGTRYRHKSGERPTRSSAEGGAEIDDKANFRSTVLRRLGSWWLKVVLRVVARVRISDPTSGFRLYGPRALHLFDQTYPYDYPEPESLAIARANGLVLAEVAVTMRERQGGTSSIAGLFTLYYMFKVTLAIVLSYIRARGGDRGGDHAASG
ncbi:MAG: glycosyltransferase family 2 protein [Deltaproteobacteria bacterium]